MLKYLRPHTIETIKVLAERLGEKFPPSEPKGVQWDHDVAREAGERLFAIYDDITHHSLYTLLESLSRAAMDELKALMWLGRGDYEHFASAMRRARQSARRGDVHYLLEKFADLPRCLAEGEAVLARVSS